MVYPEHNVAVLAEFRVSPSGFPPRLHIRCTILHQERFKVSGQELRVWALGFRALGF